MEKKPAYTIPVEGSLGLLALGAEGLRAWRKKKEEAASVAKPSKNG
jgi:hypothetical protein